MKRLGVSKLGALVECFVVVAILLFSQRVIADPAPTPPSDEEPVPEKPSPSFWDTVNLPAEQPDLPWDQTGKDPQNNDPSNQNNSLGGMNGFNNFGGFGGTGGIGGLGGFGIGGFGMGIPRNPMVSYGTTYYPSQSVSGQDAHLGVVRKNISVLMPVWRDGPDALAITTNVRNSLYQSDAVFPTSKIVFPDEIWNVNLGVNYTHMFTNGWMGTVMASVGSASDKPFENINDINGSVSAFLAYPPGKGTRGCSVCRMPRRGNFLTRSRWRPINGGRPMIL